MFTFLKSKLTLLIKVWQEQQEKQERSKDLEWRDLVHWQIVQEKSLGDATVGRMLTLKSLPRGSYLGATQGTSWPS